MKKKTLLWLDDFRNPFQDGAQWLVFSPIEATAKDVVWVTNYPEFVDWITKNGLPDGICFDHDLAEGHYHKNMQEGRINYGSDDFIPDANKTGFHCAEWLTEYCMDKGLPLPPYNVHSMNPVGKENIKGILEAFIRHQEHK